MTGPVDRSGPRIRAALDELGRLLLAENTTPSVLQRIVGLVQQSMPLGTEVSITLVRGEHPTTAAFTGQLAADRGLQAGAVAPLVLGLVEVVGQLSGEGRGGRVLAAHHRDRHLRSRRHRLRHQVDDPPQHRRLGVLGQQQPAELVQRRPRARRTRTVHGTGHVPGPLASSRPAPDARTTRHRRRKHPLLECHADVRRRSVR